MSRHYDLAEANELLPDVALRMRVLSGLRSRLQAEIAERPLEPRSDGFRSAAAFEMNEQMHRIVGWFGERDIQIKGMAPGLVDFPALQGGETVLLCWQEGEDRIAWYHRPEDGFAGRRPVSDLA